MPFAGWSPIGIVALVAIVAGIALLVVYAVGRGLVHQELEGIEAAGDAGTHTPAPSARPSPPSRSRTLGTAGALLLVVGLALGAVAALGSWTTSTSSGTGLPPEDCAQSWQGCPQATPQP